MIIFHAESVKVPVNCTLTSASELEAALPKELLPISALGKRIHHCRPRETAKSFPEPPTAKSPCSPRSLSFLSLFFPSLGRGSEGGCRIVSALLGSGKNGLAAVAEGSAGCPWVRVPGSLRGDRGLGSIPGCWGPSAPDLLLGLTEGPGSAPGLRLRGRGWQSSVQRGAGGCDGSTTRRCAPSRAAPDCLWHSSVAAKQQLQGEHLSRASCGQRAAISGCGAAGGCAEGGGSLRGPDPRGWGLHGAPQPWQGGGVSPPGSCWRMLGMCFWRRWC